MGTLAFIAQLLAGAGQRDVHRHFRQLQVQRRFLVDGDEFECTPIDVHLLTGVLLEEVDHLLERLAVEIKQRHLGVRKLGQQTLVGRRWRVSTFAATTMRDLRPVLGVGHHAGQRTAARTGHVRMRRNLCFHHTEFLMSQCKVALLGQLAVVPVQLGRHEGVAKCEGGRIVRIHEQDLIDHLQRFPVLQLLLKDANPLEVLADDSVSVVQSLLLAGHSAGFGFAASRLLVQQTCIDTQ